MNRQGVYCIIDPKGVVGPKIFDLPRFILNEMNMVSYDNCEVHIRYVIQTISKELNYSSIDIKKLLFMEDMLANVWNLEDDENIDEKQILIVHSLINE
jgi:streptomycin 6-kinase